MRTIGYIPFHKTSNQPPQTPEPAMPPVNAAENAPKNAAPPDEQAVANDKKPPRKSVKGAKEDG